MMEPRQGTLSAQVKVGRTDGVIWFLTQLEYDRTSLKPYVDLFERHVADVLKDMLEIKRGG